MSDITKMIRISKLQSGEQKLLFCYGDGETVLGIITYENGDVYMGEIKPDEAFDGKRCSSGAGWRTKAMPWPAGM